MALRIGVWGRGWDAWEHLCARGCVVDKPRFDHGTLHHIGFLHAVVGVRVGVVGTGTVLQPILLETDAIQADPRKGGRVRATGARGGPELIPARNSNDMLVLDGLNPGLGSKRPPRGPAAFSAQDFLIGLAEGTKTPEDIPLAVPRRARALIGKE